jgi:hypothetical protein
VWIKWEPRMYSLQCFTPAEEHLLLAVAKV